MPQKGHLKLYTTLKEQDFMVLKAYTQENKIPISTFISEVISRARNIPFNVLLEVLAAAQNIKAVQLLRSEALKIRLANIYYHLIFLENSWTVFSTLRAREVDELWAKTRNLKLSLAKALSQSYPNWIAEVSNPHGVYLGIAQLKTSKLTPERAREVAEYLNKNVVVPLESEVEALEKIDAPDLNAFLTILTAYVREVRAFFYAFQTS